MDTTPRLMLGDCLEHMASIPDGSVDAIICDLPYGTTACAWDVVIPFEPLWAHYRRLLKPRGAVVLTASQPFTSMLVMSNREWFRYEWIWSKRTASGFLDAGRKPMKAHESILVFGPTLPRYYPQMEVCSSDEMKRKRRHDVISKNPSTYAEGRNVSVGRNRGEKCPRTVIEINGVAPVSAEKDAGRHPTQKPVALMEYLVRTYSNPGETVLDNTMGSGTTGVACQNTGRRFIGIEKNPEYFATAERRIADAVTDLDRPHRPKPSRKPAPPTPLFALDA